MKWTKEIPTVDGWYWIKFQDNVWIEHVVDSGVWEYSATYEEYEHEKFVEEGGCEFYGPLEQPK